MYLQSIILTLMGQLLCVVHFAITIVHSVTAMILVCYSLCMREQLTRRGYECTNKETVDKILIIQVIDHSTSWNKHTGGRVG